MITTRKKLVIGNWKMNLNVHQSSILLHRLAENIKTHRNVEVVIAPSMLSLQPLSQQIDRRRFKLCAQNAYQVDEGHFTGEVSFAMLGDIVEYCIVGHSARRIYFGETLDIVRDKVQAAIRCGITPVVCLGETLHERQEGESRRVIQDQLQTALANLTSRDIENVVLVYEPTWAITTFNGITAKPSDVSHMVKYIRSQVYDLYGKRSADEMRILYGGSVNDTDVKNYLRIDGVDGVLIGAASLNYKKFTAIVEATYQVQTELGNG